MLTCIWCLWATDAHQDSQLPGLSLLMGNLKFLQGTGTNRILRASGKAVSAKSSLRHGLREQLGVVAYLRYRSYVVRCLSLMFVGWTVSIPSFEFPFLTAQL